MAAIIMYPNVITKRMKKLGHTALKKKRKLPDLNRLDRLVMSFPLAVCGDMVNSSANATVVGRRSIVHVLHC